MKNLLIASILIATSCHASPRRVVCFGDSVTEGYGVQSGASFCDRLNTLPNVKAINLGVGGNSSRDGVGRFSEVLRARPDAVVIMFGLGDAYDPEGDGARTPLEEYHFNIDWMIQKLKAKRIRVILQTSNCTTDREYNARLKPYIEIARRLAKQHKIELIENYSAFTEATMEGISYFVDYAHPNETGQGDIAERLLNLFRKRRK